MYGCRLSDEDMTTTTVHYELSDALVTVISDSKVSYWVTYLRGKIKKTICLLSQIFEYFNIKTTVLACAYQLYGVKSFLRS